MKKIVVVTVFVAYLVSRYIHLKLGLILNMLHLSDLIFDIIFPLTSITEENVKDLYIHRIKMDYLPKTIPKIFLTEDYGINMNVSFRLYRPSLRYSPKESELPPIIIYFHGGGYVLGSIESHSHITTGLAARTNFIVASVNYRLAPENKFPAAALDCLEATRWIHDHAEDIGFNKNKMVVAGDSAGGNLAAIVAHQLPSIVSLQLLIYPIIPTLGAHSHSVFKYRYAPILSANLMAWFRLMYFSDYRDLKDPLACPLNGAGLANLPPALIITAEFDILRDEGEEYSRLLQAAGNKVTCIRYNNTVHGFFGFDFLPHGVRGLDEVAAHLVDFLKTDEKWSIETPVEGLPV